MRTLESLPTLSHKYNESYLTLLVGIMRWAANFIRVSWKGEQTFPI